MNLGAIGMVMGHELTHGFDDEGRQFDGDGNLREWWTPTVSTEFERRAACVVDQFDGYVAVDDVHLNGKLTLGENLADLGGPQAGLRGPALEGCGRGARRRPKRSASSSSASPSLGARRIGRSALERSSGSIRTPRRASA